MRVVVLTNVLTPYRLPVFRDLANTPGYELRLLLSARTEFHWRQMFAEAFEQGRRELPVEAVGGLSLHRRVAMHRASGTHHDGILHLPLGVLPALRRARPDVIVSAELGIRTALAAAYAAISGVPLVIWSYASRAIHEASSPGQRLRRRLLLSRADAVIGMGAQAREGLLDLGVAPERLFDAPNAHDHAGIERALQGMDRLAARAALRASLGLRERVALVVGRLVEQKGIGRLLDAWSRLPEAVRAEWSLLFVGDGPEAARVRDAAQRRPGEIARLPAVPPAQLPELYAAGDLLVFPSLGDAWGLVVNEALACGLPVLCSTLAGCAEDLVEPDVTGWRFDPTDAAATTAALEMALRCETLERMGLHARDRAKRATPEAMAAGMRRAIAYAVARRRSAVA
jgi:glycosyltransferase involved in cell wall biosynthesis